MSAPVVPSFIPAVGDRVRSSRLIPAGPDVFTRPAPFDGHGACRPGERIFDEGPADITSVLPATYSWCRVGAAESDPLTLPCFLRIVTEDLIVDEVDPFGTPGPFTRVWSHQPGGITVASDMDWTSFELIETAGWLW